MKVHSKLIFYFLGLYDPLTKAQNIKGVNSKEWMKKALIFVVYFLQITSISAAIDINIEASQTSGVAPLHVTFDATGTTGLGDNNNYVLANFVWHFDITDTDPSGKWESTKGFFTSHVFERPGVYTVHVTVKDANGITASKNITITVTSFNQTTYYVAADGNDANTGTSEASPLLTLSEGLRRVSSGDRILLKNGHRIEEPSAINFDKNDIAVGTYGTGEKAILEITAISRGGIIIDNESNIRLMGFHLKMSNQANTAIRFGGSNNLAYDLEISEARGGAAIEHNRGINNVIWNGYFHDFGPYGIFCQQFDKVAIIGVKIRNLNFPKSEHGIRAVSGSKLYIANCDFETEIAKTAFAIRYNGKDNHVPTNHVVMVNNKVDRQVQGGWVNDLQGGDPIKYVLFEGNYIIPSPFPNSDFSPDFSGLKFRWASDVAVRNNVISKKARAIIIEGNDNATPISNIWVYNNTIINLDNGAAATGFFAISLGVNNSTIECKNNIYYGDQANSNMFGGTSSGSIISNNIHYRTIGGSYNDPAGVTHDNPDFASLSDNSPDFAYLSAGSAAIDAGAAVPVFYDKEGNERIGPIDLGAHEFIPTNSDYLNISTTAIDFEHPSGDTTINVVANVDWSASADQPWITVNPGSSTGSGFVTISISENTSTNSRTGSVVFTGTGVSNKTLTITQAAPACGMFFTETFDNTNLNSRYTYNSFIGVNNIEWTYSKGLTGDEITAGDPNTIRLDKNGTGILSGTIPNGISSISAICKKAGTNGNGALDIKVNGLVVASYFSAVNQAITIAATNLNAGVDDVVEFVTTAEKPIIIDDIRITSCPGSGIPAAGTAPFSGKTDHQPGIFFTISPNPVSSGHIRIETSGFEQPLLQIFKTLGGKAIYHKEKLPESYTINKDNFPESGLYIIRVRDGKNIKMRKLIVN
ncbi:BACON domain-containing carbohydrate-binding protein [Fulvivirgaceae bacterium BMA12]|uniref:BACON domain-containing carbohydrate-binding protein n=1 Tax=Agaribacillus aureus TaxID=3051825 RepID=A0ABT8L9J2_9BACT|nr:BACON domain-containing carbohydrate-binding protein [Fulvivirgaceae bacterium BMA12]